MTGPTADPDYMRLALELARQGAGRTSPNPAVGAVLVRDGRVVGRGFHTWTGVKHAEILALEEAGEQARGATLYVTLEPCVHQGRTGPCTEAILAAGVRRVVVAGEDPNPLVAGAGLRRLAEAGLVEQERRGRITWCKLDPDGLREAGAFLAGFGVLESVDLDAFERFLAAELEAPPPD